ncbi:uncharacterized protein FMAN_00308 [Fusarium mangiferae]|uniref:Uncharacterized protein n=1 Tax=Fusarium mangiferae TaxID=192010 RepID=A0A1L7TXW8_FUSMA|nr:uncharacterized protein FMAN_00308 [Fusarium mangiferae]CVL02879.1 uncharacterized protein FMAN_00308 [Fusarium mangiferae]
MSSSLAFAASLVETAALDISPSTTPYPPCDSWYVDTMSSIETLRV